MRSRPDRDRICDGKDVGGDDEFSIRYVRLKMVLRQQCGDSKRALRYEGLELCGGSAPEDYSWGGVSEGCHWQAYSCLQSLCYHMVTILL